MKKTTLKIYKSRGKWRWNLRDGRNGKIIAASSEGYSRRVDCIANLERVRNAELIVVETGKAE